MTNTRHLATERAKKRLKSSQSASPQAETEVGNQTEPDGVGPIAGLATAPAVRRSALAPPTGGLLGRISRTAGKQIRRVITGANITTTAKKIANGHAWKKHVQGQGNANGKEFEDLKFADEAAFQSHVEKVMASSVSKDLGGGRSAYWDESTKTIVIADPKTGDNGTCFRPTLGKAYYDKQV